MDDSLFLLAIISTVVFLLLAVFVVGFALLFQRRQLENFRDKAALKSAYEEEILKSQIEVQNQTLQRIGQELHDNIGQLLSVAKLYLDSLSSIPASDESYELIDIVNRTIDQTIADVRSMTKSLDDDFVSKFGLLDTLSHDLERLRKSRRFTVEFTTTGEAFSLGFQREIVLFRIIQEILNNIIKHAGAKHIMVHINYQPQQVELSIRDDGCGFDYEIIRQREINNSGAGLRNIQRRIELIGGYSRIKTALKQGTEVMISIPNQSHQ